ncbi:MAG: thiamine diphosphokinase [Anaerolineae bacterium]
MEAPQSLTAFIFANGDSGDGPLVRRTLAAYPDALLIAADGGLAQAAYYGLLPHVLIGDMDSVSDADVATAASRSMAVHRFPAEKNETDLELAVLHAAGAGAARIRLFAALGGRLDQTISNIYLLALPALRGIDARIVADKQEIWLAYPGETVIQGQSGDTVSLIPLNGDVQGVRTENLYYPLKDETLRFGPARGVSNVMTTDIARVHHQSGILLVVHTLGRA